MIAMIATPRAHVAAVRGSGSPARGLARAACAHYDARFAGRRPGISIPWIGLLVLASFLALAPPPAAGQCRYTAITFRGPDDPVFGPPATTATGINNHNQVVGYYSIAGGPETGFVWSEATGLVSLPSAPGGVRPADINDAGLIVGSMNGRSNPSRAFLWNGEQYVDLGVPDGGAYSNATAINEQGVVVGTWGGGQGPAFEGFIWRDGVMTRLGPTLGTPRSRAEDITDDSRVAGWMGNAPTTDGQAYVFDEPLVFPLGPIPGGFTSEARGLNDPGDLCGTGRVPREGQPNFGFHAFAWMGGAFHVFEPFEGLRANRANDINVWGQVVGTGSEGNPRGFTWRDGVLYDLEEFVDPPMVLANHTPWAINERGVITGQRDDDAIVLFPQAPPGDIDVDCRVGLKDLLLVLLDFGCGGVCVGDVNQDGQTSLPDLAILLSNWNP